MKGFYSISLRLRLTVLMAIILILSCLLLITASIFSARRVYDIPKSMVNEEIQREKLADKAPLLNQQFGPDGEIPSRRLQPELIKSAHIRQDNEFASIGLLFCALVIVFGTCATYMIAGRALKPVTDLSREIEEIDDNNLFKQVKQPMSNDEVSRLSVSFNNMIGKLEKAFVCQKNFSANAAHELKTPLAAMIASIEVLQLDENPTIGEYKETLEDTLKNAQRLNNLVNDLLKMNSDTNIAMHETFEAGEMFENIIDELSQDIQSKDVRVENHVHGVWLNGEKHLLHRAFSNIIHNAIKYNRRSGVIKISATENDDTAIISVHDTGTGIPEEHIEKIFEPFYCVDKSRSRELGGCGLGLSIVKSVIEKHGGEIIVQSEVGISTTMIIRLPNKK